MADTPSARLRSPRFRRVSATTWLIGSKIVLPDSRGLWLYSAFCFVTIEAPGAELQAYLCWVPALSAMLLSPLFQDISATTGLIGLRIYFPDSYGSWLHSAHGLRQLELCAPRSRRCRI